MKRGSGLKGLLNVTTDENSIAGSTAKREHWRPYLQYLERLAKEREARGEPPAPDVCDDTYWNNRGRVEELKQSESGVTQFAKSTTQ